jgi:hypothetical protein
MARYQPYWTVLGLDKAPEDRRTLKKAYAKKLRETRPDEDPEGFMRLRDAHDQGLEHIAYLQSHPEQDSVDVPLDNDKVMRDFSDIENENNPDPSPDVQIEPAKENIAGPQLIPVEVSSALDESDFENNGFDEKEEFLPHIFPLEDELIALLDDDTKRYERNSWAALFKQAHQLDIDEFSDFENGLLNALLGRSGYFNYYQDEDDEKFAITSQSIAASIFATLKWDETQSSGSHKAQQIAWLREKLVKPKYAVTQDDGIYVPETPDNFWTKNIWWMIVIIILLIQFGRATLNLFSNISY